MSSPDSTPASFPATDWRQLDILRDRQHPQYEPTLDRFVRLYWRPIFYALRTQGASVQQAEDWTQDFLLSLTIEGQALTKADEHRGRFRSFLLHLLRNFVADQGPGQCLRQAAFEARRAELVFTLGDEERSWEPGVASPEEEYERRWANQVIAEALRHLRERCPEDWPIFEAYRLPEGDRPTQDALAEQHDLTRDGVRALLKRADAQFVRLIKAELREEGVREAEMDDKVQGLLRILAW